MTSYIVVKVCSHFVPLSKEPWMIHEYVAVAADPVAYKDNPRATMVDACRRAIDIVSERGDAIASTTQIHNVVMAF